MCAFLGKTVAAHLIEFSRLAVKAVGQSFRLFAVLLGGLCCAACGSNGTATAPFTVSHFSTRPSVVLVTVDMAGLNPGAVPAEVTPLLEQMRNGLAEKVVVSLRRRNIPAVQNGAAVMPPGSLALSLSVTSLDLGSSLQRTAIGFGMGQSKLVAQATLHGGAEPAAALTSFVALAGSGYKPGAAFAALGMIGGQVVMPFVSGGISAMNLSRQGFEQDSIQIAEQVSRHLNDYFRALGWHDWTESPGTFLGTQPGSFGTR